MEVVFKAGVIVLPWFDSLILPQNPAPGLQVFQAPMPYAETDPDFHLCPLPRYTRKDYATNPHASTQRKYLDREVTNIPYYQGSR